MGDKLFRGSTDIRRDVQRPVLVRRACRDLERYGCVVISAPAGHGKHSLVRAISARYSARGFTTRLLRPSGKSLESSLRTLRKVLSSDDADSQAGLLLCLELSCCSTELAFERLGRVIAGIASSDIRLVISMIPSSEPLLESLSTYATIRAHDLVVAVDEVTVWSEYAAGLSRVDVIRLTNGIPSLIVALRASRFDEEGIPYGSAWEGALGPVLAEALSEGLIAEELTLRCAMALLGEGRVSDLRSFGLRASADMLRSIDEDEPLFGLDSSLTRFRVVPCRAEFIGPLVSRACAPWPELTRAVVRTLLARGDMKRAGLLARECSAVDSHELALRHAVDFIDCGLVDMVAEASDGLEADSGRARIVRDALTCIGAIPWETGPRHTWQDWVRELSGADGIGDRPAPVDGVSEATLQLLLLMLSVEVGARPVDMLGALEGRDPSLGANAGEPHPTMREPTELDGLVARARRSEDALTRRLLRHVEVQALLLSGDAQGAYRRLAVQGSLWDCRAESYSMTGALLWMDLELARLLVGDPIPPLSERDRAKLLAAMDAAPFLWVSEVVRSRVALASFTRGGAYDPAPLGRVSSRLALTGEVATLARLRMAMAYGDATIGGRGRAAVNAREALQLGEQAGLSGFKVAGRLLSCGSETVPLGGEGGPEPPDLLALEELSQAVRGKDREGVRRSVGMLGELAARPEAVCLAGLACRVDACHGAEIARALPPAWRGMRAIRGSLGDRETKSGQRGRGRAVHPMEGHERGMLPSARAASQGLAPGDAEDAPEVPSLAVKLMGGFAVLLDGVRLPEGAWHRRGAKLALALLALTPGHALSRRDLCEALWPASEFTRARENLYTTMSALRTTLGRHGDGCAYLAGGMGRIWLDAEHVAVDVDEFERLARLAVSRRTGAEETVEACAKLESLYRGGPALMAEDGLGIMVGRRAEVAARYVDALLAGVESALSLGDVQQASWMAESARAEAPDRGDVCAVVRGMSGGDEPGGVGAGLRSVRRRARESRSATPAPGVGHL